VIWFVKYNKHSNYENYCREKLILYVLFNENEETLKHNFSTWEVAYVAFETIVQINESRFTYNVNPTWGNLEIAVNDLENPNNPDEIVTNQKTTRTPCESYDLQTILKDIALKKHLNMDTHVHLFLIGGAGTGKTFIAKALFQMIIQIYDSNNSSDPMKPKGLIVAYTGKNAYNAGGTTIHSTFLMPFNKSLLPLSKEMLDTLSKIYEELQLVFIDEASLIGSWFFYSIDN
jgi:hypothetical protein